MEHTSSQEVKPLKKKNYRSVKIQISEELTLTTHLTSTYCLFSLNLERLKGSFLETACPQVF